MTSLPGTTIVFRAPCRPGAPARARRRARARELVLVRWSPATCRRSRSLPFTCTTTSTASSTSSAGSASATAAPTAGRRRARPTAPRPRAAHTAGSARRPSRPRSGRPDRRGAAAISLTSSITAAIGVWNEKRRSMSSVTFAIVRCAFRASAPSPGSPARASGLLVGDAPEPVDEPPDAFEPGVLPVHVLVGRPHEQRVHPHRVRAVAVGVLERIDDVALRLRHLARRPSLIMPWLKSRANGSRNRAEAELVHHLREEARVEQVQDRVLDAADVLVDRQPVVGDLAVERQPCRSSGRCSG